VQHYARPAVYEVLISTFFFVSCLIVPYSGEENDHLAAFPSSIFIFIFIFMLLDERDSWCRAVLLFWVCRLAGEEGSFLLGWLYMGMWMWMCMPRKVAKVI